MEIGKGYYDAGLWFGVGEKYRKKNYPADFC